MVIADPSLHKYLVADRPVSLDTIVIVHADGVYQPGDNIFFVDSLMECIFDITAYEGSALIIKIGRSLPAHGYITDLLHLDSEGLFCRLL